MYDLIFLPNITNVYDFSKNWQFSILNSCKRKSDADMKENFWYKFSKYSGIPAIKTARTLQYGPMVFENTDRVRIALYKSE